MSKPQLKLVAKGARGVARRWRGAALACGSTPSRYSVGRAYGRKSWQQAAPGNDPARRFAHRVWLVQPIELPRLKTFPGAACCQAIELPSCKAAPLQAHLGCDDVFLGERSHSLGI